MKAPTKYFRPPALLGTSEEPISRELAHMYTFNTVNSEIFARILFSRIALKGIFATLEIRDLGMIYISKRQSDFAISRGF